MLLLYRVLVFVFALAKAFCDWRVRSLSSQQEELAADVAQAKIVLDVGDFSGKDRARLVERSKNLTKKADDVEKCHNAWLTCANKYGARVTKLREWQGRKLPYTLGAVDVSSVLWAYDSFRPEVHEFVNLSFAFAQQLISRG